MFPFLIGSGIQEFWFLLLQALRRYAMLVSIDFVFLLRLCFPLYIYRESHTGQPRANFGKNASCLEIILTIYTSAYVKAKDTVLCSLAKQYLAFSLRRYDASLRSIDLNVSRISSSMHAT